MIDKSEFEEFVNEITFLHLRTQDLIQKINELDAVGHSFTNSVLELKKQVSKKQKCNLVVIFLLICIFGMQIVENF